MKASFIISPSRKDLLERLTRNDASVAACACEFHCVKKTTVVRLTVILVPSPFSLSARFSEGSQCCTFYEHFESTSQRQ